MDGKVLFSHWDGAVALKEKGGDFWLCFDGSLGGGAAKGFIEGQGAIKLGAGSVGLKLGEAWLNAHVPAAVLPFVQAGESFLDAAVAKA